MRALKTPEFNFARLKPMADVYTKIIPSYQLFKCYVFANTT